MFFLGNVFTSKKWDLVVINNAFFHFSFAPLTRDGIGVCQYLILVFLFLYIKKLIGLFWVHRNWDETVWFRAVCACALRVDFSSHKRHQIARRLHYKWIGVATLENVHHSINQWLRIYNFPNEHILNVRPHKMRKNISNLMLSLWNGWR